mgnify:CR=1 FL=1
MHPSTIADFGMDTISLSGSLEGKLKAMTDAGFGQVMLSAKDLTQHPNGVEAAGLQPFQGWDEFFLSATQGRSAADQPWAGGFEPRWGSPTLPIRPPP